MQSEWLRQLLPLLLYVTRPPGPVYTCLGSLRPLRDPCERNQTYVLAMGMQVLVLFYLVIEDHDTLFILSEIVHALGIIVLGYKLIRKKNSGGALDMLLAQPGPLAGHCSIVTIRVSCLQVYPLHLRNSPPSFLECDYSAALSWSMTFTHF